MSRLLTGLLLVVTLSACGGAQDPTSTPSTGDPSPSATAESSVASANPSESTTEDLAALEVEGAADPKAQQALERALSPVISANSGTYEFVSTTGSGQETKDHGTWNRNDRVVAGTRTIRVEERENLLAYVGTKDVVYLKPDSDVCWARLATREGVTAEDLDRLNSGFSTVLVAMSSGRGHHFSGDDIAGTVELTSVAALFNGNAHSTLELPAEPVPVVFHVLDGVATGFSTSFANVETAAAAAGGDPAQGDVDARLSASITSDAREQQVPVPQRKLVFMPDADPEVARNQQADCAAQSEE